MKINNIISYFLYFIWGILLIMGILTIWSPAWLVELSNPGKNVEAITIKDAADNYLKNKQYGNAIDQYQKALKIVPDLKGAIANLAVAYQEIGDYNKSIISYNHLLSAEPEFPGLIYFNLGDIYEKSGDFNKALDSYLMASEISAFPEKAFQKAGHIFMKQNDWENALICYKNAVNNKRDIFNSYRGMLLNSKVSYDDTNSVYLSIEKQLDKNKFEEYLTDYDITVFDNQVYNDKNLSKTYNNIGFCLAHLQRYTESKGYLDIALRIDPNNREAKNNLAYVNGKLNK